MKDVIISWNIQHPIDRWWREKYSVPFNSPGHRVSCFVDQLFEYEEDRWYNSFTPQKEPKPQTPYTAGASYWREVHYTEVQSREALNRAFEEFDLGKLDKIKKNG
jgi:hypothetical protein